MNRSEYNSLVAYVKEHDPLGASSIVYEDYGRWECRTILARILAQRLGMPNRAMEVMETVLDEWSNLNGDHLAWALCDMGVWTWNVSRDGAKALTFLQEALAVAENTPTPELSFSVRGEIWHTRLMVLHNMGRTNDAIRQVDSMLRGEANCGYEPGDESYTYYANLFLANIHRENQQWDLAIHHLKPVILYLASDYPEIIEPAQRLFHETQTQTVYQQLLKLTYHQPTFYVPQEVE